MQSQCIFNIDIAVQSEVLSHRINTRPESASTINLQVFGFVSLLQGRKDMYRHV